MSRWVVMAQVIYQDGSIGPPDYEVEGDDLNTVLGKIGTWIDSIDEETFDLTVERHER